MKDKDKVLLTKRQGTVLMISVVLVVLGFLIWAWLSTGKIGNLEEPTQRGPNPGGSWGSYAEPMVQITSVRLNTGVLGETLGPASEMLLLNTMTITIYMAIDVGAEGKYITHITLPVDTVIRPTTINVPKVIEE